MALFERECQPEALGDDSEDVDMLRQKAREALLAGRAWGLRGFRARGGVVGAHGWPQGNAGRNFSPLFSCVTIAGKIRAKHFSGNIT